MSTIAILATRSDGSAADAVLSQVSRRIVRARSAITPIRLHGHDFAAQQSEIRGVAAILVIARVDDLALDAPVQRFLASLPADSLRGAPALLLLIGDPDPAVDGAAASALRTLGTVPVGSAWIPQSQVRVFPDGGALIDPASAVPVAQLTDRLLATLHRRAPVGAVGGERVSPVAGAPDLTVRQVQAGDPDLRPLLDELVVEYGTRYGRPSAHTELTEVPAADFQPPDGAFLLLTERGESVAGGAIRRYDERTAEVKRVWTSSRHRRRGLARRVMAELERKAQELGYQRIHLTTGPRQPEARALYLAAGYRPRFDVDADPESIGPLAFAKELVPGAGEVEWTAPTWAQVLARQDISAGAAR